LVEIELDEVVGIGDARLLATRHQAFRDCGLKRCAAEGSVAVPLDRANVLSLFALLAASDIKFHVLTLLEGLEARPLDR